MSYREDMSIDAPFLAAGNNYLLTFAVDKYQEGIRSLHNPVKDARALKQCLVDQYQFIDHPDYCFERYDKDATRTSILILFKQLLLKVTEADNVVLYFAGHGYVSHLDEESYWMLSDAKKGLEMSTTCLNDERVVKFVRKLKAKNVFLIVDSCYSGSIFQNSSEVFPPQKGREKSRYILTSGRNYQRVPDGVIGGHSPFCLALLSVLRSNRKEKLLVSDICHVVPKKFDVNDSEQKPRGEPVHNLGHEGGDFAFLLKELYKPPSTLRFLTGKPSLPKEVIGREKDIKRIYEKLKNANRAVLLNGMEGIGKTTTAIAFLYEYMEDYKNIVWLKQVNDFATSLSTSYELSNNLNIKLSGNAVNDSKLILNKLSNINEKSLLIIDNGDEQLQAFKDDLPDSKNWDILITSKIELSFTEIISLDFLSEEAALKLFYAHYRLEQNDLIAKRILTRLDYHTLTIEILAKTMHSMDETNLESIDKLLADKGINIKTPIDVSAFDYSVDKEVRQLLPFLQTIFELNELSTDEYYLLKQFTALPPDFHVWDEIIALLQINEKHRKDEVTFARNQLRKKGWLLYNEVDKSFKMHLIIQDVLNVELKPKYHELQKMINSISQKLELKSNNENPATKFPWIKYGKSILKIIPKHDSGSFVSFQSNLALRCMSFGEYSTAKDIFENILSWYLKHNKEEAQVVAIIYSNLAQAYKELKYKSKALDYAKKAHDANVRKFGEIHLETAKKKLSLGSVYSEYGDDSKAFELLEAALSIFLNLCGENHHYTIVSYSSLGTVCAKLEEYEKACQNMEKALLLSIKMNGPKHMDTAIIQFNFAMIYMEVDRKKEACVLMEKVVESYIENFGIDHSNTRIKLKILAEIYKTMNRIKDLNRIEEILNKKEA